MVSQASWGRVRRAKVSAPAVRFSLNNVRLDLDDQAVFDAIAPQLISGLEKLGKAVEDVAKARCPVGEERPFNPRSSKYETLKLKPLGTMGQPGPGRPGSRLLELHGYTQTASGRRVGLPGLVEHVKPSDVKFFVGAQPKSPNRGLTPDKIDVGRTVKGAFRHQPGTLKKSIHFTGVERRGNSVVATIVADAPYAYYVHEGHKTRGASMVVGKPFLKSALINIRSRLTDPSTYQG